ncbi:MAG: 3-hydroxyacyl-CoA dehydrogenase, partial [Rhodobacteraceae bacterium]|nr:3-hydroxyacyl-CoA dehydrogenase [Paracoccaceae bacterium]
RHMFFAERAAKLPIKMENQPADITKIGVVGGGTMGAGIAYACISAGYSVVLLEEDTDGIERARQNVGRLIQAGVARGILDEAKKLALEASITYSHDYASTADIDLMIEAAFENMDVKKSIFAQLDAHVPEHAILATNTSYLDVNEIADSTKNPSRIVGLHFFAPAHIMRLLEVVHGEATSDRTLSTAYAIAKKLRKVPVLAGVCDGFIGNRILARYREAADTILMDGSTPWDVDEAMVNFGYAMGPYEAQDLSGLDIAYANRRRQDATRDPNRRYIPISDRMVDEGRLGKKVGVGWYRYPGGKGRVDDPLIEDLIREEAHFSKVTRTEISEAEIQEQLLLAMINEASDILGEGIAHSAAEIDLVSVLGYGFPRWRGGLMHYADELGVPNIVNRITKLAETDQVAWKLSDVLRHCERTGTKLSEYHLNRIDS